MAFKLSNRSLRKLKGVDPRLAQCVKYAIQITKVDFGVTEGLRTLERQKKLLKARKTKILKSKHIEGKAVDLLAYVDIDGDGKPDASWEITVYDDIADAMKKAAKYFDVSLVWGGAWKIEKGKKLDITKWKGTMQQASNAYIDYKRSKRQRPFLDGPHFELK